MNGRVLVVDDDRDLCRLLSAGLARQGFEVTTRTSAPEALAVVQSADLDAVVTDLELGGIDGIELCARILAHRPDVPVTVLTAFADLEHATAALRAGACDFLAKPPELDVLARAVARAVRRRAVRGTRYWPVLTKTDHSQGKSSHCLPVALHVSCLRQRNALISPLMRAAASDGTGGWCPSHRRRISALSFEAIQNSLVELPPPGMTAGWGSR